MSIATGQITLTDYNDAITLTGFITANSPRMQQYNPDNETFNPDWTKNPLILTASLYVMGDTNNIISSNDVQKVEWFDAANPGTPLTTGGPYSVNRETLTIKQNILSTKPAVDFICQVTYRDSTSMLDILTKMSISLSRVTNGSGITSASVWMPNGNIFKNNQIATLIAECDLWRGGAVDNTNVAYQWYNQDPSVTTDQGGGLGWRKLTSSTNSGETGYTTRQLTVPASAVPSFEVYKCIVTDLDTASNTYNENFQGTAAFIDQSDPIQMSITSTGGDVFKNGVGSSDLTAHMFRAGDEIDEDGKEYTYKWYKYDKDGVLVTGFGGSNNYKTGKTITVSSDDVDTKATFLCETSAAVGQFTVYDITDVIVSATEPANPVNGTIWLNTSGQPPYRFYMYKDGVWETTDYDSLESLDPEAYDKVRDAYNAITDLDMDNRLTRYERSVVRGELANIIGTYLSSTAAMPTIEEVDASGVGALYSIRQQARDIGVSTSNTNYVRLGTAYTALRTYLSGLAIKPWDVDSDGTLDIVSEDWDNAWKDYYLAYNFLGITVTNRQKEYSDLVGEGAVQDAIKAVSNSAQFKEAPIANPMNINAPIASLGLPSFQGRHVDVWSMTPDAQANWALGGNRIKPITNPTFSSAGSVEIIGKFYGDGTNNDEFSWDKEGRPVKTTRWVDVSLDDSFTWVFGVDGTGYKQVAVPAFSAIAPVDMSVSAVKHNGNVLTTIGDTLTAADQVMLKNADSALNITVADTDSGWGETYTPEPAEILAYFNGWKMCNGTFDQPYDGTGTKVWYPIGDLDLSRATNSNGTANPVPTDVSPTIKEQSINLYQIVYRNDTAVQEIIQFDGILSLLEGDNEVQITYPVDTPEITTGTIKYATNLATVTDNLKYWIPTLQQRVSKAEEVITDDAIINTVTQSTQYQLTLASKADTDALADYATNSDLDDLSGDIDGRINNAINAIDFSPYATKSELEQKATDITAKFQAAGGMNLIKNSIGFADLDFWGWFTNYPVETISTNELDILGFGSGFLYNPDGHNKGITQEINVIPGQPYTLSWYLNKRTSGPDSSYRFWIQILENDVVTLQVADNSAKTTVGYESSYMTYTPQSDVMQVRFIGYANVDATLTGVMLTIGDVPLKWSLSTGEVYNTNIRMNINGIRVSQLDANRQEIGFTQITPEEFAGYYDTEGKGSFQKVFYLNGDETVTRKLRATDSIVMQDIQIINVDTADRKGWAFIPNIDTE